MGRNVKPGITFYRMDSGHITNKKVRLLCNEFDSDGYYIWSCLIDYAYKEWGYYFDLNDKDVLDLFASEYCKKKISLVKEVIAGCIRRGLFSKSVHDLSGVLTSAMMQEVYVYGTAERRRQGSSFTMYKEWILIKMDVIPVNLEIVHVNKPDSSREQCTDKTRQDKTKQEDFAQPQAVTPPKRVGKKRVEQPEAYWEKIVENWFLFYKEKFAIDPSFKERDPAFLKNIIGQLKKRSARENVEWTQEVAVDILKRFLCFAYSDQWLQKHFLLKNLSEQFDKIIQLMVVPPAPVKLSERKQLSKLEREINFLYGLFQEGRSVINHMSDEHFELLQKNSFDFKDEERQEIKKSTKEYVQANELKLDANGWKSLQKRFGVIEFFKQQKVKGSETIFRMG